MIQLTIEEKTKKIVKSLIENHTWLVGIDLKGYLEIFKPFVTDLDDPMSGLFGLAVYSNEDQEYIRKKIGKKKARRLAENYMENYWISTRFLRGELIRILRRVYYLKRGEPLQIDMKQVKLNGEYGSWITIYIRGEEIPLGIVTPIIGYGIDYYYFLTPKEHK